MSISNNLKNILSTLPRTVKLVVVSKTHPAETIKEAYNAGYKIFGENKAQELISKQPLLPQDIEWHFIGHLQTNKVKYIVPFIHLIHSVESLKILSEINKEGLKNNKIVNCLFQFYIASENTKFGLSYEEAEEILNADEYKTFKNMRICGVMGMATFTEDMAQVSKEFGNLKKIFENLKTNYFSNDNTFKEISMGMSDDYKVAIEQGSTIVRVGTAIFGNR